MENFWLTQGLRQRLRKVCLIRRLLFLFLGSDNDYWTTTPSAEMPFVVGCKVVNRKKTQLIECLDMWIVVADQVCTRN